MKMIWEKEAILQLLLKFHAMEIVYTPHPFIIKKNNNLFFIYFSSTEIRLGEGVHEPSPCAYMSACLTAPEANANK